MDEAAEWASRMLGPHRDRHREAFERWYGSSPAHAEAFHEATAGVEEAGILRQGELGRARGLPEPKRPAVPLRYAFGAVVAAAVVALIFLVSAYVPSPLPGEENVQRYATAGETREVHLPDGSRMMLAEETIAVVAFTRGDRRISLERGGGRFSAAHERRPFLVAAGEAEVLARGTVFEVSLAGGRTRVSLIQGSVDVSYPAARSDTAERQVRRLRPGEHIVIGGAPQTVLARPVQSRTQSELAPRADPTSTMLQFDDTPLEQAVAEANRRSRTHITLADPSIGKLRVTGAFRAGDAGFAETLAAAFRLRLERRSDGTIILHPDETEPRS